MLRGLWGETWERSNLPRKSQESKAEYLANSIPAAGSWDSTGAGAGSCGRECWQGSAPCGSVQKHCSLLTITHRHTHVNTHLHANFLQAADIYMEACEWWCISLRFKKKKHWNHEGFLNLILSCSCQTLVLHNYNYYGIRQQPCTAAALKWTENGQTQFPSNDSRHIRVLPFS